jgi:hypothetical protein
MSTELGRSFLRLARCSVLRDRRRETRVVCASVNLENCIWPTFLSLRAGEKIFGLRVEDEWVSKAIIRIRSDDRLTVKIVRACGGCLGTRSR